MPKIKKTRNLWVCIKPLGGSVLFIPSMLITLQIGEFLQGFPKKVQIHPMHFIPQQGNHFHETWHEDFLVEVILLRLQHSEIEQDSMSLDGLGTLNSGDNPIIMLNS